MAHHTPLQKEQETRLGHTSHIQSTTGYDALEVANAKKWLVERDGADAPLVVFSDCRPGLRMPDEDPDDNIRRYAYGYTYLQCNEMSFSSIKAALQTQTTLRFSQQTETLRYFQKHCPQSRRMNVILGERSSGKTLRLSGFLTPMSPRTGFTLSSSKSPTKRRKTFSTKTLLKKTASF